MSSQQDINIRTARPDDCEAISRLVQELAEFYKMPDAPKIKADTLRRFGFGEDKAFSCFVAVDNQDGGTVIGYALYFISFSTWEGRSVYLEDLYVRPSYRNRGIGGRLWRQVAKVAVAKGSNRLEWCVLGWNSGALDMYKAKGAIDLTTDQDRHMIRLSGDKLVEFAESNNQLIKD